ncbi:response regulator transcription factor [Tardibacter chloracetimidivorans]|nr:response regulator [Tardibacter chloracetimidivorans]
MGPIVYVVDDDQGILTSLEWLLSSVQLECACFSDGAEFLDAFDNNRPSCIVLDVRMPAMSGFDVLDQIVDRRLTAPVIFVTANGNIPMAVKAMQQGCFNFIEKPYDPQKMLDLVFKALRIATSELEQTRDSHMFEARFDLLSNREKEILREVVKGKRSKVIAYEFGISCKTVDAHRSSIREKFQSTSLTSLVKEVLNFKPEWRH